MKEEIGKTGKTREEEETGKVEEVGKTEGTGKEEKTGMKEKIGKTGKVREDREGKGGRKQREDRESRGGGGDWEGREDRNERENMKDWKGWGERGDREDTESRGGWEERECCNEREDMEDMEKREDRMIDFVARNYEENRFDPEKRLRSLNFGRSLWFDRLTNRSKRTNQSKRRNSGIWLAGIAAATLVGIFLYTSWHSSWTDYAAYDVAQTFTLPDSSSVTLAPGATLGLQRHKDNRLVRMTGKVYFEVRHDGRAPFRIEAGDGFVKVLGTHFQVDASSPRDPAGSVSVSVVSGKVLFSSVGSTKGVVLTGGRSAILSSSSPEPVEIGQMHPNPAAWATGEFVYDGTPLKDVISELSDYYGVTLAVRSPGSPSSAFPPSPVPDLCLTGEFSTASLPEILSLIRSALGVDIQISQDN